jgi:hypothetical protein
MTTRLKQYGDMDEQHYRQALHDAGFILGGQVERLAQ